MVLGGDDVGAAAAAFLPERQLAVLLEQVGRQDGLARLQCHPGAHLVKPMPAQGFVEVVGVLLHLREVVRVFGLAQKLVDQRQYLVWGLGQQVVVHHQQ